MWVLYGEAPQNGVGMPTSDHPAAKTVGMPEGEGEHWLSEN